MRLPSLRRGAAFIVACATLFLVFFFAVRPWYLSWGATELELRRSLPGDEIVPTPRPHDSSTRAITIEAPAAEVWPWVAQLGQDRGGFYSFELLEDLVGCEMENADRIHPEFQEWNPGDKLWMYPPEKFGGQGHALLARYEPGRALGFATRQIGTPPSAPYNGSWSFVVEPIDAHTSRLLARGRATGPRAFFAAAFDHVIFEPIHFMMERAMMEGIKQRAEGGRASEVTGVAEVILWTLVFAHVITTAVLVFRRQKWLLPLVAFVAAAIVFQILTLGQPPFVLGAPLVLVAVAVTWLLSNRAGVIGAISAARGSR